MKQKLKVPKEEIDKSTIVVGGFNTLLNASQLRTN